MSLNPRIADWQGRRVWLVGGSSGIGRALAELLIRRGARVAVSARSADKLQSLVALSPQVKALPLDVNRLGDWQQAAGELERDWQGIDHFIFCAAAYRPVRADQLRPDVIAEMVTTNVQGAMTGVATVLPALLARSSGAISMIASVAGYTGLPKALVYGPTKAALINFCESLYLDVHPRGVAVHLINPGFVDTPLTQQNDFTMPALMTPDAAALEIVTGMERGDFEIHFPRRFTHWLRLLRRLPYRLRFALLANVAEKT
ncbi:MAG: short chain dehydrogenase family protein [Moraxellaceae bacterium]|jgi:short-subunit dehydrogenase|nr:short chain dehydrogenase family protein [Moraxellaceae bacterium]